jgi:uncharacterized repeat protein (TIGR01451 family)
MIAPVAKSAKRTHRFVAMSVLVGVTLAVGAGVATAEGVPTADLAIVSDTADISHAKVGDEVTFTVVATNHGPDAAELDVVEYLPSAFAFVAHECDRGISADGPFCEYGTIQPGETVTTRVVAVVVEKSDKYVTHTACVMSEEVIVDTDASNDCAAATVKITGKAA